MGFTLAYFDTTLPDLEITFLFLMRFEAVRIATVKMTQYHTHPIHTHARTHAAFIHCLVRVKPQNFALHCNEKRSDREQYDHITHCRGEIKSSILRIFTWGAVVLLLVSLLHIENDMFMGLHVLI